MVAMGYGLSEIDWKRQKPKNISQSFRIGWQMWQYSKEHRPKSIELKVWGSVVGGGVWTIYF